MTGLTLFPASARPLNLSASVAWERISELDTPFRKGGRTYRVVVEGQRRKDGTWGGRVAFLDGVKVRRTEQETSQPNRTDLEYWATGLEQVFLDGAFERAEEGRS